MDTRNTAKNNGRGVVPQPKMGKEQDLMNFNSQDLANWLKQLAITYASLVQHGQGAQQREQSKLHALD